MIAKINRIGQFSLIVTFLTGGAMVSQVDPMPSVLWMISSIVLLLIVGAIMGMIGGRIKKLIANSKAGKSTASDAAKIKTFS